MEQLQIKIKNIKGIENADLCLPLDSGIYALVGGNGSGKSTILQALAQLVKPPNALFALRKTDHSTESQVDFAVGETKDSWYYCTKKKDWKNSIYSDSRKGRNNNIVINGMYEGSLFVGTRFSDSKIIDNLLREGKVQESDIVPAYDYVIEQLSRILHGDTTKYIDLKKIDRMPLCRELGLKNNPYFIPSRYGGLISQYKMSSGECLLISLLHFIYNMIIRSNRPRNQTTIMLLDEIELALHPQAVSRFIDLLEEIIKKYENIVVVLTTHATEVIRRVNPRNLFKLMNEDGKITYTNPCYPSYAIRDLYQHDKFDYVLLCEDNLAKCFIDKIITNKKLRTSKLIHVLPAGGWTQVLDLHMDLARNNVMGAGTAIVSILDGDIEERCNRKVEYKDTKKLFLPIASIEKFLFEKIYKKGDESFKKVINDKYFTLKSLDQLIKDYNTSLADNKTTADNKTFYTFLLNDLKGRRISEEEFVGKICEDIMGITDTTKFVNSLTSLIG